MGDTRIVRLACPRCKGGVFEQYHVEQPNKLEGTGHSNAFHYEVSKCVRCDWESHPFDEDEARIVAQEAFEIATMTKERIAQLREEQPLRFFEKFAVCDEV